MQPYEISRIIKEVSHLGGHHPETSEINEVFEWRKQIDKILLDYSGQNDCLTVPERIGKLLLKHEYHQNYQDQLRKAMKILGWLPQIKEWLKSNSVAETENANMAYLLAYPEKFKEAIKILREKGVELDRRWDATVRWISQNQAELNQPERIKFLKKKHGTEYSKMCLECARKGFSVGDLRERVEQAGWDQ